MHDAGLQRLAPHCSGEVRSPRPDPAAAWLRQPSAQRLLTNSQECSPFVGAWDLGAGESSVIMLALEGDGRQAVLDDLERIK